MVKCLSLSPVDDLSRLKALDEACIATGRELLIELVMQDPPLAEIYAAGIKPDWWEALTRETLKSNGRRSSRTIQRTILIAGVLLLGMEASEDELERGFAAHRAPPGVQGLRGGALDLRRAARLWFADKAERSGSDLPRGEELRGPGRRMAESEVSMQRIGFIGVGLMGHGMAKNLLKKGHPLSFLVHLESFFFRTSAPCSI